MPISPVKPVVYQLVIRYFGNTNLTNKLNGTLKENGSGRFEDINERAIRQIKELGCTHIWLTGAIRQATLTDYSGVGLPSDDPDIVKGLAGSMYSIRDYFDVCPDYAKEPANRMREFEALVQRIHAAELKVLIDFVPNHVARSYKTMNAAQANFGDADDRTQFFTAENNFYYLVDPPNQKLRLTHPGHWNPPGQVFDGLFQLEDGEQGRTPRVTGNNIASPNPPVDAWYEVVKLNYGFNFVTGKKQFDPIPRTWTDMDKVLNFWQSKGVDGFRCDFAHYVPQEAWSYLIDNARNKNRNAETFFIAEAYPWVGSGDPITDKHQLIKAGFDAIYNGEAYRLLKNVYHGQSTVDDYDREMTSLPESERAHSITYIENHDEVRAAAPLEFNGFGSMRANYQLAPVQYLYGSGPVLILNGQEVGEPGSGNKGFSGEDGRTTIFDYWCMPEFAKWVNKHSYDGALLSTDQRQLRQFLADLLKLCQDPSVRGSGYWGLKYHNRRANFTDCPDDLYSFARYEPFSSRVLIVVANFNAEKEITGNIRLPNELAAAVHLNQGLSVRLLLSEQGSCNQELARLQRPQLIANGFGVSLAPQTSRVYSIE